MKIKDILFHTLPFIIIILAILTGVLSVIIMNNYFITPEFFRNGISIIVTVVSILIYRVLLIYLYKKYF